jgi:transposase-like protein
MELILNKYEETDFMGRTRRRFDATFKAKVALEALKEEKTMSQLSSEYGVHPNQIQQWKKHLLSELPGIFSRNGGRSKDEREGLTDELYKQIGQLKVELDWLKKKSEQLS